MACRQPKPTEGVSDRILRQRAHGRIRSQIKAGLMIVPDECNHCEQNPGIGKDGRRLLQAHHHKGYLEPLAVEWLCVQCHRDETPCNPLRGEAAIHSKLTEDDVRAIRASPLGNRTLARQYGVHKANIYQIRKGLTWAHIA